MFLIIFVSLGAVFRRPTHQFFYHVVFFFVDSLLSLSVKVPHSFTAGLKSICFATDFLTSSCRIEQTTTPWPRSWW